MKTTDLGFVALRLISLYLLVGGVLGFISSLAWMFEVSSDPVEGGALGRAVFVSAYLAVIAVAVFVFVRAQSLSRRLFHTVAEADVSASAYRSRRSPSPFWACSSPPRPFRRSARPWGDSFGY